MNDASYYRQWLKRVRDKLNRQLDNKEPAPIIKSTISEMNLVSQALMEAIYEI